MYPKELEAYKWLNKKYNPIDEYVIKRCWYGIIQQHDNTFAIKKVDLENCYYEIDEGEWLKWPEDRYETESGANYAVLLNVNELD